MNKVFLDTSYAVALSSRTDEKHERATQLAEELEASDTYFVTTRAILLEIGNAFGEGASSSGGGEIAHRTGK